VKHFPSRRAHLYYRESVTSTVLTEIKSEADLAVALGMSAAIELKFEKE